MEEKFIKLAIEEAKKGISLGDGGPFGAVIIDENNQILSTGHNKVLTSHDPTNHAEIVAIREACRKRNSQDLSGCKIYSTCEPCPMCLSAIIWANIKDIYYSSTREEADKIGFRDKDIYDFLNNKNTLINKTKIDSIDCDTLLESYQGDRY